MLCFLEAKVYIRKMEKPGIAGKRFEISNRNLIKDLISLIVRLICKIGKAEE
jgi:hypothetical protein